MPVTSAHDRPFLLPAAARRSPSTVDWSAIDAAPAATDLAPGGGMSFFVFQLYTFVLVCRPQDYLQSLVPLRLALVFTILTSLITLFGRRDTGNSPFRHTETRLYFLVFAAMCVGIPFAINRRISFDLVVLSYVVSMVFYLLFVVHVNTIAKFRRVVFVLVLSSLIFSAMGLVRGRFHGGRFDTGSAMFDPNDVAFMNICLLPFGLAAMLGSFRTLTKALGLASVLLAVLLALYTGSRGGLLGLASMFLLLLAVRIPKVSKFHKSLLVLAVVATAVMVADKINVDRYLTLADVGSDYNVSSEEGRLQIWKRGLQLFSERPITGVGVNGFWQAIGEMRENENVVPLWQAPHNSYVEILTETGLVGVIPFVLLIATCVKTLNSLRLRDEPSYDKDLDMLPGICFVGFISLLVAAFFLSQAYSLSLTLFFAISASLKSIAATPRADTVPTEA